MENIKIDITINGKKTSLSETLFNEIKELFESNSKCKKDPFKIKTKEDILEYHGIDKCEFDKMSIILGKKAVAFRYLELLYEALNDGWKPDFTDNNQKKYLNYFKIENGEFVFYCTTYTYCRYGDMHVPSALYFKNEELAIYCKDEFVDLYKELYL
jgi:hypothetical protein